MTADVEVDCVKLCVNNACAVDRRGRGQMTRKPRQCRLNHSSGGINRHGGGPAVVLYRVYLDDSGHCLAHQKSAEATVVIVYRALAIALSVIDNFDVIICR